MEIAWAVAVEYMLQRARGYKELISLLGVRVVSKSLNLDMLTVMQTFSSFNGVYLHPLIGAKEACESVRAHAANVQVLCALNCCGKVAGSFTLHSYLVSQGKLPSWKFSDIDVFLPNSVGTMSDVFDMLPASINMADNTSDYSSSDTGQYSTASHVYVETATPPLVPRQDLENYLCRHRRWRSHAATIMSQYDQRVCIPRHSSLSYGIRFVKYAEILFDTVDGERSQIINFVFTTIADVRKSHAITDSFDMTCCAVAVKMSEDGTHLHYETRKCVSDAIRNGRLQLTSNAFRIGVAADVETAIRTQLKRISKYMKRGFAFA